MKFFCQFITYSLILGNLSRSVDDACSSYHFRDGISNVGYLISEGMSSDCPISGRFVEDSIYEDQKPVKNQRSNWPFDSNGQCRARINGGCPLSSNLQAKFCDSQFNKDKISDYNCVGHWMTSKPLISEKDNSTSLHSGRVLLSLTSSKSKIKNSLCIDYKVWKMNATSKRDSKINDNISISTNICDSQYSDKEQNWLQMVREGPCHEALIDKSIVQSTSSAPVNLNREKVTSTMTNFCLLCTILFVLNA